MLLLDAPPATHTLVEPDRARVVRSPTGMSSVMRLPNGTDVPLFGGTGIFSGMYPPNYLEDLRSADQ
jgi:hypothetical protein